MLRWIAALGEALNGNMATKASVFAVGSDERSSDAAGRDILALLLGEAALHAEAGGNVEALLAELLTGKALQDVLAQPAALALEAKQLSQEIQSVAYEVCLLRVCVFVH